MRTRAALRGFAGGVALTLTGCLAAFIIDIATRPKDK